MNTKKLLSAFFMLFAFISYNEVWAYSSDKEDPNCKDPIFRDFNLPTYDAKTKHEIPAESELSFTVSGWSDPETIKVTAKNKPLDFSIENRNTFFIITTRLPSTFNGKFVRVNVSAKAVLGCDAQTGWLLKIAQPILGAETVTTPEPVKEDISQVPAAPSEDKKSGADKTEPVIAVEPAI